MNFLEFRTWFDERFSRLLTEKSTTFASYSTSVDVGTIVSYIAEIAQEGKRFRPFLVYRASGKFTDVQTHFLLLASVEMLHIFALIHDDIMDEADTRHGVVCAHKKFTEQYGETTGNALGILLGDIVFAWAYECLCEYTALVPEHRDRLAQEFIRLVNEVTHGQMLDVLSPVQALLEEEAIIEKMILKTARYSFVQPMRLGFVVAGDHAIDQIFADTYGVALGVGFQLQDDLLDLLPTEETGKSRYTDIQTGQQTIVSNYLFRHPEIRYAQAFTELFRTPLSQDQEHVLGTLLTDSGAIDHIQMMIRQYFTEAREAIAQYRSHDAETWSTIVSLVDQRKK